MKRIIAIIIALAASLTLVACSGDNTSKPDNSSDTSMTNSADTSSEGTESKGDETEESKPVESAYADALAVLEAIWDNYPDDDKFSALGGNRDAMVEGKPGNFDLSATDEMTSSLLIPSSNIADMKTVASLVNMMNLNTFTSAVFQTDGDLEDLSQTLVDAANAKQFICGAPETIITLKIDNYLILALGADGNVQTFKTHALEVEGVALIHEGPITFNGGSSSGGVGGVGGVVIPVG